MLQQINLYPHLKKPAKLFLNLEIIIVFNIAFIILLIINTAYDISKKNKLQNKIDVLSSTLTKELDHLAYIKSIYPSVILSDLQGSIQRLKNELKSKNAMFSLLSRQTFFSKFLTAYGKAIIPSVWLTNFEITEQGRKMVLKGLTTDPMQLHTFIQHLRSEAIFSKMDFHLEEVAQTPENKKIAPYSSFSIVATSENL